MELLSKGLSLHLDDTDVIKSYISINKLIMSFLGKVDEI